MSCKANVSWILPCNIPDTGEHSRGLKSWTSGWHGTTSPPTFSKSFQQSKCEFAWIPYINIYRVGGFNHLKNISQIGSFRQVGVKIKNVWNHQPAINYFGYILGVVTSHEVTVLVPSFPAPFICQTPAPSEDCSKQGEWCYAKTLGTMATSHAGSSFSAGSSNYYNVQSNKWSFMSLKSRRLEGQFSQFVAVSF